MTNEKFLKLLNNAELQLHQKFKLSQMTTIIENCSDITELKKLLIDAVTEIMTKDNIIKSLFNEVIK